MSFFVIIYNKNNKNRFRIITPQFQKYFNFILHIVIYFKRNAYFTIHFVIKCLLHAYYPYNKVKEQIFIMYRYLKNLLF